MELKGFMFVMLVQVVRTQNKYGDHGIVLTALPSILHEGYKSIISVPTTPKEVANYNGEMPGFNFGFLLRQPFSCGVDYDRNQVYVYDHHIRSLLLLDNWNSSAIKDELNITTQHFGISPEYAKIAVDWVSHNVYWTDPLMNWIAMQPGGAINDRTLYKIVVQKDLMLPRALAIDPLEGRLFWSDYRGSDSRIESSDLSGADRRHVVVKGLVEPLAIVADTSTTRVYWIDISSIESARYDGSDRRHILTDTQASYFDIALFEDVLIVTDIYNYISYDGSDENYVRFYNKHNGSVAAEPYINTDEALFGVCVYHKNVQPVGQDLCKTAGCSDICVEQGGEAVCMCRDGFALQDDMSCTEATGQHHRAIVISTGEELCLLDIRILSDHHDYAPYCFYKLPASDTENITLMDLNMLSRHVYFALENFLYRVVIDGEPTQQRYTILETNFNITGLSYNYRDNMIYYAVADSPPQIWAVDPINVQHSKEIKQTQTGDDPHNLVVVPHTEKAYWISGGNTMEYMDLGQVNTEIKEVALTFSLESPKRLVHDIKYDMLFALEIGFFGSSHTGLTGIDYNGTVTNYLEADDHVEEFAIYGEYLLMVHEQDGKHILKSADLGLGNPLSEVVSGSITGIDRVFAMKVLDLEVLQPYSPSQCGDSTNYGGCQQLCLPNSSGPNARCECYVGYDLQPDGTCTATPVTDDFILVTDFTYNQIFQIPLSDPTRAIAVPIPDVGRPDGVIYNYMNDEVLWSSYEQSDIWAVHLNGSREHVFAYIRETVYARPDRIALDHSTGNIYYTAVSEIAEFLYDSMIGVINKDGAHAIVVWDGHEPRDIVLDSAEGYMFWTDHGDIAPGIFKAKMDGSSAEEIATDNVIWPNGLALDYREKMLFWTDGSLNRIYTCDYFGNNRALVRQLGEMEHLMDIVLVGDFLYFTDINKRQIQKMYKNGVGAITQIGPQGLGNLQAMNVYQSTEIANMPKNDACSVKNGGCSDFCFPMPGGDNSCGCDWYYSILADGKTCENAPLCPAVFPNGVVIESSTCVRAKDHSCSFRCSNMYKPRLDVNTLTCTGNRDVDGNLQWNIMDPCEEIKCPDYVDNGRVNETCSLVPGTVCVYHCDDMFQRNSSNTHIRCLSDGIWNYTSENISVCTERILPTRPPAPSRSTGSRSLAIGLGVGIGVILVILIILVIVILLIRMGKIGSPFSKNQNSDTNTTSFENPRYANDSVDLQAVGTESNRSFNYATLEEDKMDLTKESWRKTQQQAAQSTNNVYDNGTPK